MTLDRARATVETRAVPDALQRSISVEHTVRDEKLRMRTHVAHRADYSTMVEHTNWSSIAERHAEHRALRQVGECGDVLECTHLDGASPFNAACSVCQGMLAHFTRIGKRETPLKAAISPMARAAFSSGLSWPVTSP